MNDSIKMDNSSSSHKIITSEIFATEQYKREMHHCFIRALERHGTSRKNAWENISSDTGWSVKEVKAYAYCYMLQLHEITSRHKGECQFNETSIENDVSSSDKSKRKYHEQKSLTETAHWSTEESILFDNLMAKYYNDNDDHNEIVVKVTAFIPSKNEQEVWNRLR